ncbi:hypothetical protein Bbelb_010060 [Branchiostoma belcheri]|nr:hypothetical protein Bbelb_010060 [Branchiostoma belcheri]
MRERLFFYHQGDRNHCGETPVSCVYLMLSKKILWMKNILVLQQEFGLLGNHPSTSEAEPHPSSIVCSGQHTRVESYCVVQNFGFNRTSGRVPTLVGGSAGRFGTAKKRTADRGTAKKRTAARGTAKKRTAARGTAKKRAWPLSKE